MDDYPTISQIRATHARLEDLIIETPVFHWNHRGINAVVGDETEVFLKLELFQHTGTFKPRGALNVMLNADTGALKNGVTAVSAGNHAIAVAYSAQHVGASAKVVMPRTANPFRVSQCQKYGAEVVLVDNVSQAFAEVKRIESEEGRLFVHPFEGPLTALGTAGVGLELSEQVPNLDAVIVPIGGGGLCAGIAAAIKQLQSECTVYGVEPEGADSMHRSFAANEPRSIDKVRTIADSLGAPHAAPYSFGLCRQFVDELTLINDDQIRAAMGLLFRSMKLAVEPAGAAATAALCGPLREKCRGKRVGVIICGANIDVATFADQVGSAEK